MGSHQLNPSPAKENEFGIYPLTAVCGILSTNKKEAKETIEKKKKDL